jgi:hypothetical protein
VSNSKNIRVLLHGTLTDIKLSSTSEVVSEVEVSSLHNKKRTIRAKKLDLNKNDILQIYSYLNSEEYSK